MNGFFEFAEAFLFSSSARHKIINLFSFVLNVCYIYFNLISGIIYENILSVTVAAYYIVIVFVRYLVIGDIFEEENEQKCEEAHTASVLLFILAFPITGIVFYTLITGRVRVYPIWMLSVFGVYSFFSVFRSLLGLRENLKNKSVTAHTAYSARLSAALMSMFNFQTSFFAIFVSDSVFVQRLNRAVGIFISVSVFSLALWAIKRRN